MYHQPVMLAECLEALDIKENGVYIDCTLGGGGHSEGILKKLIHGRCFSIDQDDDAIHFATERLHSFPQWRAIRGNFVDMRQLCGLPANSVDGILMDLGVSSWQLDSADRGFSFQQDADLDMRMNQSQELNAMDIVNHYSLQELKRIFFNYGEENHSSKIAKEIIRRREDGPIRRTNQLRDIIEKSVPPKSSAKSCARIFQAIRIEVNRELLTLEKALMEAYELLTNNGRLVIMSYHSIEDRIVKNFMKSKPRESYRSKFDVYPQEENDYWELINKKPIEANELEKKQNPRSRSAKLRIAKKIIRGGP